MIYAEIIKFILKSLILLNQLIFYDNKYFIKFSVLKNQNNFNLNYNFKKLHLKFINNFIEKRKYTILSKLNFKVNYKL